MLQYFFFVNDDARAIFFFFLNYIFKKVHSARMVKMRMSQSDVEGFFLRFS